MVCSAAESPLLSCFACIMVCHAVAASWARRHAMTSSGVPAQVVRYALSQAPGPATPIDLSKAVSGVNFIALTVRVLTVAGGATILVVGGEDYTSYPALPGIVVTVRVPKGG